MLFSEKYPDMVRIDEVKDGIMRSNETCPCSICGHPTEYIEINYEGYFCSDECVDEMDRMAEEHTGKMECRILKAEGTFYVPMKDGETKEEAMDRFDDAVSIDEVEFAVYKVSVINDDGTEIE